MATSFINPTQSVDSSTVADSTSSKAKTPADSLTNESTFLQLLVAQIKNQDPLNPTDGVQFLTQLTGFSQLEQLMQINQELTPQASSTGTGDSSTTTSSTNPAS
jgi:flagellar basal-body rod modification protein FlgD